MTWGTLLATPKRLEDESIGADDGPAFRLPERKRRDELGRKLGSKASRAIADRARAYAPTPGRTSRTPSLPDSLRSRRDAAAMPPPGTPRAGSLTPAARSLLDRSMGRTPRGGSGLGLGLGSGGTARGAAMEKGSAWARGGLGGKSWTPSPAPRR
jgi:protein DGCR14